MNIACNAAPYSGKDSFVFVHFSGKDQNNAFTLIEMLACEGYRVWYAPKTAGDAGEAEEKTREIGERIRTCTAMIALYSAEAACDHQFRKVVTAAVLNGKRILPVFLEDTALSCGMKMQIENNPGISWYAQTDDISGLKSTKEMERVKGNPDPGVRISIRTSNSVDAPKKIEWGVSVIIENEEDILKKKRIPQTPDAKEKMQEDCGADVASGVPVKPECKCVPEQEKEPDDAEQPEQEKEPDNAERPEQEKEPDNAERPEQEKKPDNAERQEHKEAPEQQAESRSPRRNRRPLQYRRPLQDAGRQNEIHREEADEGTAFMGLDGGHAKTADGYGNNVRCRYATETMEDMHRTMLVDPQESEKSGSDARKGRNGTLIIDVIKPFCIRIPSGERIRLNEGVTRIGRSPSCDVCIREDTVSSEHLEIISFAEGDGIYKNTIRDCGSSNGTWVNGKRIKKDSAVKVGNSAMISLSKMVFLFAAFGAMAESLEISDVLGCLECRDLREMQVLCEDDYILGRFDPWNNGFFADPAISWEHARITRCAGKYQLTDQSSNGTIVNGRRIAKGEPVVLADGDQLSMGRRSFVFRLIPLKEK